MRHAEPPARNYLIFAAIEFERASLDDVARANGVSVERVQQIVKQTRAWYVASTPQWAGGVPLALQPLVAARMFDERLSQLSREAQQAWEDSKGLITITRKSATSSSGQTTTTNSAGQPRYLVTLARLAKMQFEGMLRLTAWRHAHRDLEPAIASASDAASPYARDEDEAPEETWDDDDVAELTDVEATTSDADCETVTYFGDKKTNAPAPMRSRKERRKRQRMLQRKLAKK
jgi:hypothetical protein